MGASRLPLPLALALLVAAVAAVPASGATPRAVYKVAGTVTETVTWNNHEEVADRDCASGFAVTHQEGSKSLSFRVSAGARIVFGKPASVSPRMPFVVGYGRSGRGSALPARLTATQQGVDTFICGDTTSEDNSGCGRHRDRADLRLVFDRTRTRIGAEDRRHRTWNDLGSCPYPGTLSGSFLSPSLDPSARRSLRRWESDVFRKKRRRITVRASASETEVFGEGLVTTTTTWRVTLTRVRR